MKKMVLFLLSSLLLSNAKEVNYYPAASYSSDKVRELFKEVEFSDPSVSVHEIKEYCVKGRMIVEFGDVAQLEQSLDDGIALSASKIYFSYVPGKKSLNISGEIQESKAYEVKGAKGFHVTGKINVGGSSVFFPSGSKFSGLNGRYRKLSTDPGVSCRKSVIKFFYDNNRHDIIKSRTQDARNLSEYVNDRLTNKSDLDHRDEFDQTYPELFVFSEAPLTYLMSQVIKSIGEIIVMARSIDDMKALKKDIKFSHHVRLLSPDYEFGVYSPQPLTLEPKVRISTPQSLLVMGKFHNNLTFLKFKSGQNFVGTFSARTSNFSVTANGRAYFSSIFQGIEFECYERMSAELYRNFLDHLVGINFIEEEWASCCFVLKQSGKPVDSLKNLFAVRSLLSQSLSDSSSSDD